MTIWEAYNAGLAVHQAGRLPEAEALYRQILAVFPGYADAWHLLGVAAQQSGRNEEAVEHLTRAISLNPGGVDYHKNLAITLQALRRPAEAAAAFEIAAQRKPGDAVVQSNLSVAYLDLGRVSDAVAAGERAVALEPGLFQGHTNLGNALKELGRLPEAEAALRAALALQPQFATAHNNLGLVLQSQGRGAEALASHREAARLAPGDARIASNLIIVLKFEPGQEEALGTELARWNERHAAPLRAARVAHGNAPDPERRLRVGYVSPDFRDHVIGRNVLPLLERHDRKRFDIFCYAEAAWHDSLTARFQNCVDVWRETRGLSDDALARQMREDGVDILVDLALHLAGNRLPLFARQPAPVQLSFAGYPGTTGVETIGYRLTDQWLEPEARGGAAGGEAALDLGGPWWCFDPLGEVPEVGPLPARSAGVVTFGCLNNFAKVNEAVLALWGRVLSRVEGSRLCLLAPQGVARERTLAFLVAQGVAPQRVDFVAPRPRAEYLAYHGQIDVMLDSFPYGGHTTAIEALWMGVPVVTLAGATPISRAGVSILNHLGRPEWIAETEGEYVEIARALVADREALAERRDSLRGEMERSLLMDAAGFARRVETAYRTAWRRWCEMRGEEL